MSDYTADAKTADYEGVAKTNPPITDAMQRLQKDVIELRDLAEKVAAHFAPVLAPESPETQTDIDSIPRGSSSLVGELHDVRRQIVRARSSLVDAMHRCEL